MLADTGRPEPLAERSCQIHAPMLTYRVRTPLMDTDRIADLVWTAGALLIVVLILLTRRARRHGGALRGGVVGSLYEWQNKDKQRALDLIVERKAAARRPEYPDDARGPKPDDRKRAGLEP